MSSLFNVDAEKPFLAKCIEKPEILADCSFITDKDFSEANRVVFSALRSCVSSGVPFSKFLLIDRLASCNVKIGGVLEPAVYINALSLLVVSDKGAIGLAQEIKRTTIRRELNAIGRDIQSLTDKDDPDKTVTDLVAEVTLKFNQHVNIIEGSRESEPVDLYGTIDDFVYSENTFTGRSVIPPWKLFVDFYGYLDAGTAPHLIASRMKIGKSSFWLSMGLQLAQQDKDDSLRILVLDTELSVAENQSRSLAQVSGVQEFLIRQGLYRKDPQKKKAVEDAAAILKPLTKRVSHQYCGAMSLEGIASLIRRWTAKNITEGKRGLVVYDYIKLMGADFKSQQAMHIQVASKMEMLKNLCKELNLPCLCFCQTNRENVDSKAGGSQRSSAVIGGSDMLSQFASNVLLLEELTPDERASLGQLAPGSATHSLRDIACRQLGENRHGEARMVKYEDERGKSHYCKNYLLYNFESFNVKEVGTFREAWERSRVTGVDVQREKGDEGGRVL